MFDNNAEKVNLSGEATRSTMGSIASGLGWLALLVLALATAGHAVSITMAWANLNPAGGDLVAILALIGVALVEVFAVLIAVMYATHSLRAKQKPVAMMVEAAWFVFAAVNLISSFSMKHGGEIPTFVGSWVTYGLPVAGLIVGGLFYVVMRLGPYAAPADDVGELGALLALGLNALGPVHDGAVARAAEVRGDLLGPLVRRVHGVRPAH